MTKNSKNILQQNAKKATSNNVDTNYIATASNQKKVQVITKVETSSMIQHSTVLPVIN